MTLKLSSSIGVSARDTRGLAYNRDAYDARADVFHVMPEIGIKALMGVPVKAGAETPVSVTVPGLPVNADLRSITAKLQVTALGSAEQVRPVSVKEGSAPARKFEIGVDSTPGLRNVQVRLQGGQPIWTRGGAVPAGTYDLPDFAAQANAYLDQASIAGDSVVFQFLVSSETDGGVAISVTPGFTYSLLQTQSWKNDLDSTVRIDRNLPLEFNSVEILPLEPIAAARAIVRSAIRLDAGGQFGPDRLLGEVVEFDGREMARVSPDYSVAQQVRLSPGIAKSSLRCSGISAFLECDAPAELYVELQPDAGGTPAAGGPLAKATCALEPPQPGAPQLWTFAGFDGQAELNLDVPYWVVVKAVRGEARLGLRTRRDDPSAPVVYGDAMVNRGGDKWKCLAPVPGRRDGCGPVVALAGIVYVPDPDSQTAAVHVQIVGSSAEQKFDPAAQPQRIDLSLAGDGYPQATLVIRSHARGLLTLANVVQEYALS
jgi:hypothetical protein